MAARRLRYAAIGVSLACAATAVVLGACSSAALDSIGFGGDASTSDGSSFEDGGFPGNAVVPIQVDALLVVHAARFPAFRVCFGNALDQRPTPDSELMPDSNVVGVDVGTAIRLPPPDPGVLGTAFLYEEAKLRPLYPAFGGSQVGPTCEQLLQANEVPYVGVGNITTDLSTGVHALVLRGCQSAALDPEASVARCGEDWTADSGNLTLDAQTITAYHRPSGTSGFPMQLVQLSPSLASASAGHALAISFGALAADAGDDAAAPTIIAEGLAPLGVAVPDPPAVLVFRPDDLPSYATSGVLLSIGQAVDDAGFPTGDPDGGDAGDAGASKVLLTESLAQIQQRSASHSIPPEWFAVASSYLMLSIGDLDPRLDDGGPDTDERRALHLLAIPLAAPDAGSDASSN